MSIKSPNQGNSKEELKQIPFGNLARVCKPLGAKFESGLELLGPEPEKREKYRNCSNNCSLKRTSWKCTFHVGPRLSAFGNSSFDKIYINIFVNSTKFKAVEVFQYWAYTLHTDLKAKIADAGKPYRKLFLEPIAIFVFLSATMRCCVQIKIIILYFNICIIFLFFVFYE